MENSNGDQMGKTLKEGERVLAATRRPDGTMRKPIRIRAGYVPQDEVAIYKSKGALRKEKASQEMPPGYDPVLDAKPKTKSVKRNERKKEKKLQAALEKGKDLESMADGQIENEEVLASQEVNYEPLESLASQMNELAVSSNPDVATIPSQSSEGSNAGCPVQDIDKKIRALKKKIRLAEAQLQKTAQQDIKPEQMDKLSKLEDWRKDLKLLEDKKAEVEAS